MISLSEENYFCLEPSCPVFSFPQQLPRTNRRRGNCRTYLLFLQISQIFAVSANISSGSLIGRVGENILSNVLPLFFLLEILFAGTIRSPVLIENSTSLSVLASNMTFNKTSSHLKLFKSKFLRTLRICHH